MCVYVCLCVFWDEEQDKCHILVTNGNLSSSQQVCISRNYEFHLGVLGCLCYIRLFISQMKLKEMRNHKNSEVRKTMEYPIVK